MIGFLSCVDSKVAFEGLQVPEACAADLTGVRLLPGVNEHVSTEVGHLQRQLWVRTASHREQGYPCGNGVCPDSFYGLLGYSWESGPCV